MVVRVIFVRVIRIRSMIVIRVLVGVRVSLVNETGVLKKSVRRGRQAKSHQRNGHDCLHMSHISMKLFCRYGRKAICLSRLWPRLCQQPLQWKVPVNLETAVDRG
jgi:hypothetical protein